jgi:hypothetical protein
MENNKNALDFILSKLKERKKFYSNATYCHEILAKKSWFITGELGRSDYESLLFCLDRGNDPDVVFTEIYEENMDHLAGVFYSRYPKRKEVVKQAIFAHKNENYYLSVLAFLSMADGLFNEFFKWNVFQNDSHRETVNEAITKFQKKLDTDIGVLQSFFVLQDMVIPSFSILKDKLYISYNEKKRSGMKGEYNAPINRHRILHGEDFNYGVKVNSVRAFSFLAYADDIIQICLSYGLVPQEELGNM